MAYFQITDMDLAGRCDELRQPNYLNLTLSIFILFGILVSYLPQHYRIISRRTSEGISPYFILLGTTSGTCAFANILVHPTSRADMGCCQTISGFECAAGLLGIVQVGVQYFCFCVILVLWLSFFPRGSTLPTDNSSTKHYTWRAAVIVGITCVIHALVVAIISIAFIVSRPGALATWANLLGITATILACIQYIPQIWMTWHRGDIGSLSIPMMLIQTPGSFVWSASLAARLGWAGWSTWGLFLVTGCLQGCLLVMGICFEIKVRRNKQHTEGENTNARCVVGYISTSRSHPETDDEGGLVSETTGLLKGSKKASKKKSRSRSASRARG